MSYGFVYILSNESMPGIYKIGCTERSPSKRASELSGSTGVPTNFELVCYAEFSDFQFIERDIHQHFASRRVSDSREFFRGPLVDLFEYLERCTEPLSFAACDAHYLLHQEQQRADDQFKRNHFFSQSADPIYWPGFRGFE